VINRVLKLDHRPRQSKIDVAGSALVVGGVSLLLIGVQTAGSAARITSSAWAWAIPGVVMLVAFVWWETRAQEPIVPMHLFRNPVFAVANILSFVTSSVMFGALIFIPLYLQSVRGVSPTVSGLRLLPMLAGVLLTSISAGRLVSAFGRYKMFVVSGTAILSAGLGLMTTITPGTGAWPLAGMMFVVGAGLGLFMQILVLVVQNTVPPQHMGVGTATVTFFRTLGGAVGSAVLGAILLLNERSSLPHYEQVYGAGSRLATAHAFTHGMDRAYLYALPPAVLSFLLSFLLREVRLRSGRSGGGADGKPSVAVEALG
jgi:predicted MFS family arabinose efflux permease